MLGKRLKLLRNEKKLYQKDIAKELNLTQESISFYESGKREPDYKTLIKFADFYGVSVDYLIGRTNIRANAALNHKEYNKSRSCNSLYSAIDCLSVESQKEIKKLVDLYKIKELEERNKKHDSNLNGIGR
jgi:transcriptional regulator with XRE-family HTH domain